MLQDDIAKMQATMNMIESVFTMITPPLQNGNNILKKTFLSIAPKDNKTIVCYNTYTNFPEKCKWFLHYAN